MNIFIRCWKLILVFSFLALYCLTPLAHGAVAISDKLWPTGSELRVEFLNGTEEQKNYTMEVASRWTNFGNISIIRVNQGASDIRVEFTTGDSNSSVGTDAQSIVDNMSTMRLFLPQNAIGDPVAQGIILHEFGHAFGLKHEHQSPSIDLCWDEPEVYRYGASLGYSNQRTQEEYLTRVSSSVSQFTTFDPNSVMLYFLPARLFTCGLAFNSFNELSSLDKQFFNEIYPASSTPPSTPTSNPTTSGGGGGGGCQYIKGADHPFDPTLPLSFLFSLAYIFRRKLKFF